MTNLLRKARKALKKNTKEEPNPTPPSPLNKDKTSLRHIRLSKALHLKPACKPPTQTNNKDAKGPAGRSEPAQIRHKGLRMSVFGGKLVWELTRNFKATTVLFPCRTTLLMNFAFSARARQAGRLLHGRLDSRPGRNQLLQKA